MQLLAGLFLAALFLLNACAPQQNDRQTSVKRIKMVLDLDTGIDDALALAYAVADPEVELLGVTGTFGNVVLERGVRNLAKAMEKDPAFAGKVGEIVIMGGAVTVPGNTTRFAEANVYNDPVAANEVLGSAAHVTMVGLDVTYRTVITEKETAAWRSLGVPAAVVAVDPSLVTTFDLNIKVGTEGLNMAGQPVTRPICWRNTRMFPSALTWTTNVSTVNSRMS